MIISFSNFAYENDTFIIQFSEENGESKVISEESVFNNLLQTYLIKTFCSNLPNERNIKMRRCSHFINNFVVIITDKNTFSTLLISLSTPKTTFE
jgi:predicted transcriptional regulator